MTKISSIMALSNSRFLVTLFDDAPFCTSLASPKRYSVSRNRVGMTAEGYDLIYATSLAAATDGLDVTVWYEDSTSSCEVTRIQAVFSGR